MGILTEEEVPPAYCPVVESTHSGGLIGVDGQSPVSKVDGHSFHSTHGINRFENVKVVEKQDSEAYYGSNPENGRQLGRNPNRLARCGY